MATITLKGGDFGSEVSVTVGETALYLPDLARPGLNEAIGLSDVIEIDSHADDRSSQLKEAARLGVRGLLASGNPLGLAAGVFALTKVKDVEFSVRLRDGRSFVAIADAATLANLRGACHSARTAAALEDEAAARADAVIAKYVGRDALSPGSLPVTAPTVDAAPTSSTVPPEPHPPGPPRRVFGRRGGR
jgi:hypothetical protein